ncbi:MAG: hypothetical protein ACREJQ_00225 [bacterium]
MAEKLLWLVIFILWPVFCGWLFIRLHGMIRSQSLKVNFRSMAMLFGASMTVLSMDEFKQVPTAAVFLPIRKHSIDKYEWQVVADFFIVNVPAIVLFIAAATVSDVVRVKK